MLACVARKEVGSMVNEEFLHHGTSTDAIKMTSTKGVSIARTKGRKHTTMGRKHENLSIALLKALPNLLI